MGIASRKSKGNWRPLLVRTLPFGCKNLNELIRYTFVFFQANFEMNTVGESPYLHFTLFRNCTTIFSSPLFGLRSVLIRGLGGLVGFIGFIILSVLWYF